MYINVTVFYLETENTTVEPESRSVECVNTERINRILRELGREHSINGSQVTPCATQEEVTEEFSTNDSDATLTQDNPLTTTDEYTTADEGGTEEFTASYPIPSTGFFKFCHIVYVT